MTVWKLPFKCKELAIVNDLKLGSFSWHTQKKNDENKTQHPMALSKTMLLRASYYFHSKAFHFLVSVCFLFVFSSAVCRFPCFVLQSIWIFLLLNFWTASYFSLFVFSPVSHSFIVVIVCNLFVFSIVSCVIFLLFSTLALLLLPFLRVHRALQRINSYPSHLMSRVVRRVEKEEKQNTRRNGKCWWNL